MLSCDLAETCVFGKQSPLPDYCEIYSQREQIRPFSRSYGANLPSSLERVLLRPLVFSTNLPVSVSGTGFLNVLEYYSGVRAFLGSLTSLTLYPNKFRRVGSRLSYRFVFFRSVQKNLERFHCIPFTDSI